VIKTTAIVSPGFSILLNGTVILWKSKLQQVVALSSLEAEYYALSEATNDVKFVVMIVESIGIKVELPLLRQCRRNLYGRKCIGNC
jgi:hypothetical protein